jgi:thioredoxin 1
MSDQSQRAVRFESENIESISTASGPALPAATGRTRRPVALVLALGLALAAGLAGAAPSAATDAGRGRQSQAAATGDAAKVLKVTGFSFERQVLRAEVPVIVDFWAPWCIVCRELDGPLAAVAAKFAGRARVVRVNVDWSSGVAGRYGVQSLPTILVFSRGELVSRSIGGASEQDLEEMLTAQLAPATVAAQPGAGPQSGAGVVAAGAGR